MDSILDIDDGDLALAIVMQDEILFALMFWGDDLKQEMSVEQKMMFCDRSRKVLVCTGRKIAKTVAVECKVIQLGINHIQDGTGVTEALLFTPQDNQLSPIVDRIVSRLFRTPWLNAFVAPGAIRRGESPRMQFSTGLVWYFRIEGVDGSDRNMVGLRAAFILGDEMAFGSENPHNSRLQTALPTARWWYSGVPNGVRTSPFYRLDQTSLGDTWSRHKYPTHVNPLYQNDRAKKQLIEDYGGERTQGYITQVLGKWGDEVLSSFPPDAIAVGTHVYFKKMLGAGLQNKEQFIAVSLGLPAIRASRFAIGWDYGYSPDPSVVTVAYSNEKNKWLVYARIEMRQVVLPIQSRVIRYIYRNLLVGGGLMALSCDSADAIQTLQGDDPIMADRFFQVKVGGTMIMVDDTGAPVMGINQDTGKEEVVKVWTKQYLTEKLRGYMIAKNLDLPGIQLTLGQDVEVIEELTGTTESKTGAGRVVYYGPPDATSSGKMRDHNVDALRYLSDAIIRAADKVAASDDDLVSAMGWTKRPDGQVVGAPYSDAIATGRSRSDAFHRD